MNPYLRHGLLLLAGSLPMLLVYGVGIAVCIQGRARHPEPARWFMAAFILFAAITLLEPIPAAWLATKVTEVPHHGVELGWTYGITTGLLGILHYAGWGVLIYAVRRALWVKAVAGGA